MQSKTIQSLNGKGWIGAILFVGAPALAGILWQSSMTEFARKLRLFGADSIYAQDALHPPGPYIALSVASLVGLVMLVTGRDYFTEIAETPNSAD